MITETSLFIFLSVILHTTVREYFQSINQIMFLEQSYSFSDFQIFFKSKVYWTLLWPNGSYLIWLLSLQTCFNHFFSVCFFKYMTMFFPLQNLDLMFCLIFYLSFFNSLIYLHLSDFNAKITFTERLSFTIPSKLLLILVVCPSYYPIILFPSWCNTFYNT